MSCCWLRAALSACPAPPGGCRSAADAWRGVLVRCVPRAAKGSAAAQARSSDASHARCSPADLVQKRSVRPACRTASPSPSSAAAPSSSRGAGSITVSELRTMTPLGARLGSTDHEREAAESLAQRRFQLFRKTPCFVIQPSTAGMLWLASSPASLSIALAERVWSAFSPICDAITSTSPTHVSSSRAPRPSSSTRRRSAASWGCRAAARTSPTHPIIMAGESWSCACSAAMPLGAAEVIVEGNHPFRSCRQSWPRAIDCAFA
mmetsp:Transcript_7797/g.24407  ORF Transcript_7797/g.24407 Transcript_7797/m.24407 type:complete len:263 (-) Transcript_7797:4-792(-)